MRSLLNLPGPLAALAISLVSGVESRSHHPWVPRDAHETENMVVDLGMTQISATGTECQLQDLSNEPVLAYRKAQRNATYLATAMSFLVQKPSEILSESLDPVEMFFEYEPYLSFVQTSLRTRKDQASILTSQVNPMVPFQLPDPSCDEVVILWMFIFTQPHPFLVEDCVTEEFSAMEEDSSKRVNYNLANFAGLSESTGLGEARAATWVVINNDRPECQGENDSTLASGEVITTTITTVISSSTVTITTTVRAAASQGAGENGREENGGGENEAGQNVVEGATGGAGAVETTTTTTVISGTTQTITTTVPLAAGGATPKPSPKPSGKVSQAGGDGNRGKNGQNKSPGDDSESEGSPTTTDGGGVTSDDDDDEDSSPASPSSSPGVNAKNNKSGKNNKTRSSDQESPSSESFVTSVKTITSTMTDGEGSTSTTLITTTETSTVLNLQAPGIKNIAGKPNDADASPTSSSNSPGTGGASSTLRLPLPSDDGFGRNGNANADVEAEDEDDNSGGGGGGRSGSAGANKDEITREETDSGAAMGADAEPAVVAAVLLGGAASFYFAFL